MRGGAVDRVTGTPTCISPARAVAALTASLSRFSSVPRTSTSPLRAPVNCWRSRPASGGEPNSGDTTNSVIAKPSWVLAVAEWIRSEFSASTAAAFDTNARWSGATITTCMRSLSPGLISTCTPWSAASERYCGAVGSACGSGSPAITIRQRRTRSSIRDAFHSLHTPGPVALESASVSACKTSSNCGSPPRASDTPLIVLGSFKSLRVATTGSSK